MLTIADLGAWVAVLLIGYLEWRLLAELGCGVYEIVGLFIVTRMASVNAPEPLTDLARHITRHVKFLD
ncbi:MAG: hypothetical protein ACI915_004565 [Gammaproteobacteria bacterium]|jgi:hypothetical protein